MILLPNKEASQIENDCLVCEASKVIYQILMKNAFIFSKNPFSFFPGFGWKLGELRSFSSVARSVTAELLGCSDKEISAL